MNLLDLCCLTAALVALIAVRCVESKKKVIFIVADYRTGSSFTGSVVSATHGSLFIFEPLRLFGMSMVPESQMQSARQLLSHMISCRFKESTEKLNFTDYSFAFNYQRRQLHLRERVKKKQFSKYLSDAERKATERCRESSVMVVKTTRILLKDLMPLLSDESFRESFDYHILVMVRDPRAVLNSRIRLRWCIKVDWCIAEEQLCSHLRDNHLAYLIASPGVKERIHFVRFEDLTEEPLQTASDLYKQLSLPFTDKVKQFIRDHTGSAKGHESSPYSIYRRSRSVGEKWKTQLPSAFVKDIERNCQDILTLFKYK